MWADFCLLQGYEKRINLVQNNNKDDLLTGDKLIGFNLSGFNSKINEQGYLTFEFPVISNLIITDNVDVNRPIIFVGKRANNEHYSTRVKESFTKGIVSSVRPEGSAYKAGMLAGDNIIEIDNKKMNSLTDIADTVGANPNKPLLFKVLRNNKIISLSITPKRSNDSSRRGLIGIFFERTKTLGLKGKHLVEYSISDISSDGTLFDPFGVDLDETQRARRVPPGNALVLLENGWLSIPGIVQSSIGLNSIETITYFDIQGRKKTIKPNLIGITPREDLEFINNNGLYFTINNLDISENSYKKLNEKNEYGSFKLVENDIIPSIFSNKKPSISQQNIYELFTTLADIPPTNWFSSQPKQIQNIKKAFDKLDTNTKTKLIYDLNDKIIYEYKMNPLYSQSLGPLSLTYLSAAFEILTKENKMVFDLNTQTGIDNFFKQIPNL